MGVYIGYIEKVPNNAGTFYNIKPFAEIYNGEILELENSEREALLPKSREQCVMLYYDFRDNETQETLEALFATESLAIFEFAEGDLENNNTKGYQVRAIEFIKNEKLRKLKSESIYYAVHEDRVISNFLTDSGVIIDVPEKCKGESALVEMGDYWVGPYEITYRSIDSEYVIVPKLKKSKYTVNAYRKGDVTIQKLTYQEGGWGRSEKTWTLIFPQKNADEEKLDVMTNEFLLEEFRESLSGSHSNAGSIDLKDIPALLKHYEESGLVGTDLPKSIQEKRLNRLTDILTSETALDDSLCALADSVCDLLIRYQKSPNVALDYAVVQRILPKLSGHGDSYKQWLEELRSFCSSRGLNRSAEKLKDMLFRGDQQMNYYQFFC